MALILLTCSCFLQLQVPQSHTNVAMPLKCLSRDSVMYKLEPSAIYKPDGARRTAKYRPSIWNYDFVQSLRSDYVGEAYARRTKKSTEEIKFLLKEVVEPLAQLELIDALQRLGVGYHFEKEFKEALKTICARKNNNNNNNMGTIENDLHGTALQFRLLREHGYHVSQDVFNKFKDERGSFISSLCQDIKGMISLYEASHLAFQGETVLDECKAFTRTHLKGYKGNVDTMLAKKVEHALQLPMQWRMPRIEALWYLNTYESEEHMNPTLLELAKLDFNIVQAIHQNDLREASRWWMNLGIGGKLSFSRDRLLESFFVAMGVMIEPQFGFCRVGLAKVIQFITTIDDIYDVFGSLDELECFTDAVDRWDIKSMERLPEYMKICFLALLNTTNEMGYEILKDQGLNIIPYLHKVWADMCKAMLVEAKWYYSGYRPRLQEYLNNAWITSSGPVVLVHALLLSKHTISREVLDALENNPNPIYWSSLLFRLSNDLVTYKDEKERGDAPSSIDCYMHEFNISEMNARDHIRDLIFDTWKKLNEEVSSGSPYPFHFINSTINFARVGHCIYQYGDEHSVPDRKTKDRVMSLLVEPIPVKER